MSDPARLRDAVKYALFFMQRYDVEGGLERFETVYRTINIDDRPPAGMALQLYGATGGTIRGIGLWRSRDEFDQHFVTVVSGAVANMVRDFGAATGEHGEGGDIQPDAIVIDDVLTGALAASFAVPGPKDSRELVTELKERPVLMELNVPGLTKQQYHAAIANSGLEAPMPEGLIVHFAGDSPNGYLIEQVWRSEAEARASVASVLAPALRAELGADALDSLDDVTVFKLERLAFNGEFGDGLVY